MLKISITFSEILRIFYFDQFSRLFISKNWHQRALKFIQIEINLQCIIKDLFVANWGFQQVLITNDPLCRVLGPKFTFQKNPRKLKHALHYCMIILRDAMKWGTSDSLESLVQIPKPDESPSSDSDSDSK